MNYPTVYARITPTNGVSGDKYSVSVTGVTATVDTQKTWSSGSLIFAITPSALGTMVVTFKNDTLGITIGTKSIPVVSGDIGFVTNMTVKLDTTPGFDPSDEPSDSGNRTNRYSEGDFYVSRGSNGSFQLQGVKGTIANPNVVLTGWSFKLFSWFTWREDTWGTEGWVNTAQSYPSINLINVSGTPPNTFYAKFGDTSYTFTRQADVNGRLVYSDITKGNDNGFKYDGISTRLNFALTPV